MSAAPFHALTGCDSTSALSGIGKKEAWKVLIKKNQGDHSRLGESSSLQDPARKIAEAFICSIYASEKSFVNADEARYFLFARRF